MSKLTLCAFTWLALAAAVFAQAKPAKPVTESDLLNKPFDNLGDPVLRPPLSFGKDEPKKEKDEKSAPRKTSGQTEITSKEASFDQKAHVAIFTHEVLVINPEFRITCEKLTAYLKQSAVAPAGGAKATPTPPKATPAPAIGANGKPVRKRDSGGLDRAVAEGSVVITQEKIENGNVTYNVGKGRKAIYMAETGDIILSGHPECSQGINTLVATDDSTIITLNLDGQMRADGPTKTVIKDNGNEGSNGR